MATNFPTGLDTFLDPSAVDNLDSATPGLKHHTQHTNINDAVAALEAKVGIDSSAVTTSLDYKINHISASAPYTYDPGTGSSGTNAGSSNYKGVLFTPSSNMSLTEITVQFAGLTASATYQAFVVTLASNSPGATTVATIVGSTTLLTMNVSNAGVTAGKVTMAFASPLALTGGTTYAFMPGSPSQAGNMVGQQYYNAGFNGNITLANPPGVLGDWVAIGVTPIIVGSAASVVSAAVSRPSVGFTAKL